MTSNHDFDIRSTPRERRMKTLFLVSRSIALAVGAFTALRVAIGPASQVTPLGDILPTNLSALGLVKHAL